MIRVYPGNTKYHVSSKGYVIGPRKVLKASLQSNGYYTVTVSDRTMYVHRIVVEAFMGPIPEDMEVNHKDGDKSNCALRNLEVVTRSENHLHASKLGLKPSTKGQRNGQAKLSLREAKQVILYVERGYSNQEIGSRFGLHPNYVSLIRHRRRWVHLWEKYDAYISRKVQRPAARRRCKRTEMESTLTQQGLNERVVIWSGLHSDMQRSIRRVVVSDYH